MIHFECDYTEGCCPEILSALNATNLEQTAGYGEDEYSRRARQKIGTLCGCPEEAVHFLAGGTQTNLTVIGAALRPHQGVIAPESGHINVHEAGAVEATGHKVLSLPAPDGKLSAEQIDRLCAGHWSDQNRAHTVQPGMAYISFPTESGMLYSRSELEAVSAVCRKHGLLLFVDGARMGYGLASPANDCTLADFARLCDVFYIGGTKVGALLGEAVVIPNRTLRADFLYMIKQKGGLLAKGRLLGIQFDTLFTDDLYLEISRRAVDCALQIKDAFRRKGVPLLFDSCTNQQFPVLGLDERDTLAKKYSASFWQQLDNGRAAVRFCTSWATTQENLQSLLLDIGRL